MSKDLQVIDNVASTQLAHYANRDVVRELMERVMSFHPVISKIKRAHPAAAQEVGLRVAQLAILLGASPLPGLNEIHVYDDGRAEVGINYWVRRGEQRGGVLWDFESRPMTRQEQEMYGIEDDYLGAICRGVPLAKVRELRELGVGLNDIVKGQSLTGIGVVKKSDRPKNGRPPIWTAIKRAKTDFYKTAFPYIPGETAVKPGAGMRLTDNGYEPDFSNRQWDDMGGRENGDAYEYDLDDFDINEIAFDAEPQIDDDFNQDHESVIEGEIVDTETEEEPEEETAVIDESKVADLRASLETDDEPTLGIVVNYAVKVGAFETNDQAWNRVKEFKFPNPQNIKYEDGQRLTRKGAVKVFDWILK